MIIKVTVSGIDRMIERQSRRLHFMSKESMREVLKEAGRELVEAFKLKIQSFTPGSVRDLAESTKKQKMRQVGLVYPILVRSGFLFSSMRSIVKSAGRGWTIALNFVGSHPNGGANDDIAKAHIEGTNRVPKRDFTAIPARWREQLFQRLRDRLRDA